MILLRVANNSKGPPLCIVQRQGLGGQAAAAVRVAG
jgi:hypothetical protein